MAEVLRRNGDALNAPWEEDTSQSTIDEPVQLHTSNDKELRCDSDVAFLAPGDLDEVTPVDELNWKDRGSAESRETDRVYKCAGDRLWSGGGNRGVPAGLRRKAAGKEDEDDDMEEKRGDGGDDGDDGPGNNTLYKTRTSNRPSTRDSLLELDSDSRLELELLDAYKDDVFKDMRNAEDHKSREFLIKLMLELEKDKAEVLRPYDDLRPSMIGPGPRLSIPDHTWSRQVMKWGPSSEAFRADYNIRGYAVSREETGRERNDSRRISANSVRSSQRLGGAAAFAETQDHSLSASMATSDAPKPSSNNTPTAPPSRPPQAAHISAAAPSRIFSLSPGTRSSRSIVSRRDAAAPLAFRLLALRSRDERDSATRLSAELDADEGVD